MFCAALVSSCSNAQSNPLPVESSSSSESIAVTEPDAGDNTDLEQIYLESVHNLYANHIDLFGNEVVSALDQDEYNHFAICDIDQDGVPELILSWMNAPVAGMWGGVYQYDMEQMVYIDEGLVQPGITFYDNGVAYEPWKHNQGYGEIWPFVASRYNAESDRYEHALTADSWNRSFHPEGFPEEADTDGAGVVYFTDLDSEYVDYDHPINQTVFTEIYNDLFADANEISVTYYELSDKGIAEYEEMEQ